MNPQTALLSMNPAEEAAVRSLYQRLLAAWNKQNAGDFAALFAADSNDGP
jgi:hypothetical protein